jgi:hypothetical protein
MSRHGIEEFKQARHEHSEPAFRQDNYVGRQDVRAAENYLRPKNQVSSQVNDILGNFAIEDKGASVYQAAAQQTDEHAAKGAERYDPRQIVEPKVSRPGLDEKAAGPAVSRPGLDGKAAGPAVSRPGLGDDQKGAERYDPRQIVEPIPNERPNRKHDR